MHIAVQKNQLRICWLLILSQISPTSYLVDDENKGDYDIIQVLLDQVDQWGNTVLHTAAANDNHQIVFWLLQMGAKTMKKNMYDMTALDVTTNKFCRSMLRDKRCTETKGPTAKEMIKKYYSFKSSLEEVIHSSMEETCKAYDLYQLQDLIDSAAEFGIAKELIDTCLDRMRWLKMRGELLIQIENIKNSAPILTHAGYEYVNELQRCINKANEEGIKSLLPKEIVNVIEDALTLCYRSSTEFNLHKVCQKCEKISCANEANGNMMELLKTTIDAAKIAKGNEKVVDNAEHVYLKLMSEFNLQDAIDNLPKPKLPLPDITPKQAKSYWNEVDIGHIEETDDYPLPPPGNEGYIWIKSESLQCLENALNDLRQSIKEAEAREANPVLIQSGKAILKVKSDVDLKLLCEKDEADYKIASAIAVKAAKKLMKMKKGQKKAAP